MSLRVIISDADTSEVLEDFRVICLEGENVAHAQALVEVVGVRYDVDDSNDA